MTVRQGATRFVVGWALILGLVGVATLQSLFGLGRRLLSATGVR